MSVVKLRNLGKVPGVTLPKAELERAHMRVGERVTVEAELGVITIRAIEHVQPRRAWSSLADMLQNSSPETLAELRAVDIESVGREI